MTSPVRVVGIGCLSALGMDYHTCMNRLFMSPPDPAPPKNFKSDHVKSYPVFEIQNEPEEPDPVRYSRTARLAWAAAQNALKGTSLKLSRINPYRVGVVIGTTVGAAMNNEAFYRDYRDGGDPDMAPIVRYLESNPARVIANELSLSGPCRTVVNACSSGTDAIGIGAGWIQAGECDVVLAGGADELCRTTYNGFISLMITDVAPCRPFDTARKGLNLGEGAAVMVLAARSVAVSMNIPIKGWVSAYGAGCDAFHLTAPAPDGRGLHLALDWIFRDNNLDSTQISFVNAHGTGTKDNDKTESRVLGERLPGVPFFSTKRFTGHTLGAAGAIEAAITLGCLNAGKIPKSAGFTRPDPDLTGMPVTVETGISGTIALSQSLAFGGNNAVLALCGGGV